MAQHMGIDQHGQTYHSLGEHPRKALMERLGYASARKMYRDRKDGASRHCGWVIGPYWIEVFKVCPINS